MKKFICVFLLLVVIIYNAGFGEMITARSPTVIVSVKSRQEEYGRGGLSTSRKIKVDGIVSFNGNKIVETDFPKKEDEPVTIGLIYKEETKNDRLVIDYSLIFDNSNDEICSEIYYYNIKNNIYAKISCYDIVLEYENDMPVWKLNENIETENYGLFSSEDGYDSLNDFVWKGIIGVDENTNPIIVRHKSCAVIDNNVIEISHTIDYFNLLRRKDYEEVFVSDSGVRDDDWLLLGIGSRY